MTISKKDITVSGIKALDKEYDQTTTATLNYDEVVLTGKLEADKLTVTAKGVFTDADVGEDKVVTISGLTLGGESAGNYQLAAEGQQATTTASILALKQGTLDVEVVSDPGAPTIGASNLQDIAPLLAAGEDLTKNIKIWLECTKIDETKVPEQDRKVLIAAVDELGATVYMWIDLSLFMQVESRKIKQISETPVDISFSIRIPDELKKEGRTFYLIRVHNGEKKVLATTTGDVLEGKTNLFSTYLIAYKDTPTPSSTPTTEPTATPSPTPRPTPKPVPKTGDNGNPALWLGIMAAGMAFLVAMIMTDRKRNYGKKK